MSWANAGALPLDVLFGMIFGIDFFPSKLTPQFWEHSNFIYSDHIMKLAGKHMAIASCSFKGRVSEGVILCGRGEIPKIAFLVGIWAWSSLQNFSKKFGVGAVIGVGVEWGDSQGWGDGSKIKSLQCKCESQKLDSQSPCKHGQIAVTCNLSTLVEDTGNAWAMLAS